MSIDLIMLAQVEMKKIFTSVLRIALIKLFLFASLLLLILFVTNSNELAQDSFITMQSIQGTNDDYLELLNQSNNVKSKTQQQQDLSHSEDYYDPDHSLTDHNIDKSDYNNHNTDISKYGGNMLSNFNRSPEKEYLVHNLAEKACGLDRGCPRKDRLNNTYMNYCTRYKLENLLSNEILMSIMHEDQCYNLLDEFIQLDEMIENFDRLFRKLLTRYNCHNGYSVKWNCDDCKKAYKDWLCATNLPYYMNGEQIKPCISFCERVEQRCPYLHPIAKGQYGGQPVFICKDPNIPFVPEITPDIPYSEPSKCYDLCHLSENITELTTDSLSKYDYDKCPDKKFIAAEVHKDPFYCSLENHKHTNLTSQQTGYDLANEYNSNEDSIAVGIEKSTITGTNNKHRVPETHAHYKKLNELKEVLALYKRNNQPKLHSFGHHSPRRA